MEKVKKFKKNVKKGDERSFLGDKVEIKWVVYSLERIIFTAGSNELTLNPYYLLWHSNTKLPSSTVKILPNT
jgi:hypothetical protein